MNTGNRMMLVVVFIAALLCATVRAQSVVGTVSTTFDVAIPGVLVTGTRTNPPQTATDTTDANGNYSRMRLVWAE